MKITFGSSLSGDTLGMDGKMWKNCLLISRMGKDIYYGIPDSFKKGFNYSGKCWLPYDCSSPFIHFEEDDIENPGFPHLIINPHT